MKSIKERVRIRDVHSVIEAKSDKREPRRPLKAPRRRLTAVEQALGAINLVTKTSQAMSLFRSS